MLYNEVSFEFTQHIYSGVQLSGTTTCFGQKYVIVPLNLAQK